MKKVGGNGNTIFSRSIPFTLKLMMIPEHLLDAIKVQM